jgi:rhamnosyl/mannosyltransferase
VATYHSDIVNQTTALRFYGPILERFLEQVDRIITTSPRMLDHSRFLSPHREKCTVVPYGIDVEPFDGADTTTVDLPGDDDLPVILFVGRLVYYKGLEYLVDALTDVEARLVVVGDGDQRDNLEAQAAAAGVDDRVHFLGEVVGDRLHALYDRGDVFALPSSAPSEAFAIVQLEAMASHTPVVNTDLPTGVPWVSKHGETGLTVPTEDPAALAAALNELIDDPERRKTLGAAGRARVEESFTFETTYDGVIDVYEELDD